MIEFLVRFVQTCSWLVFHEHMNKHEQMNKQMTNTCFVTLWFSIHNVEKITDAAIAAGLIARSDDEQSENIPQLTENDHLLNTPINTNTEFSFEIISTNFEK